MRFTLRDLLWFTALVAMGVYWIANGGHRGELIEIDRAGPLTAQFQVDINKADWPELAELPPYRAVLVVDAKGFGTASDPDQALLGDAIPDVVAKAFERAGLERVWRLRRRLRVC